MTHKVLILFILLRTLSLQAQWIPSEGIDGAPVTDLVVLDSTIFISTEGNGIFSRRIYGGAWSQKLPGMAFENMAKCGNAIFTWNWYYCYRSVDHGNSWQEMTTIWNIGTPTSLCAIDSTLFLATYYGLNGTAYRSDDFGNTVYPIANGLPSLEYPMVSNGDSGTLFCYQTFSPHKIFQSDDKGASWDSISTLGLPPLPYETETISRLGTNNWLATNAAVYKHNNQQEEWIMVQDSVYFRKMGILNNQLFASSNVQGLYRLDDTQSHWLPENSGLETLKTGGFCSMDTIFYLATMAGPYRCSTPYDWIPFYDGLYQSDVKTLSFHDEEVWIVTLRGTFKSFDHGSTFTKHSMNGAPDPEELIMTDSAFYMFAADSFYVSHDHGSNWVKQNTGLPVQSPWPFLQTNSLVKLSNYLFLGTNMGLYQSPCQNINWTKVNSLGLPDPISINLFCDETNLLAVKAVHNNNYFHTFQSVDNGMTFDSVTTLPMGYQPAFAFDGSDFYALSINELFKSSDGGSSWSGIPIGNSDIYGILLTAQKPAIIVGGSKLSITLYDTYLSITHDDGLTWTDIRGNLPVPSWPTMNLAAIHQQRTFASSSLNGLWYQDGLLTATSNLPVYDKNSVKLIPNPSSGKTSVEFVLTENLSGSIMVSDMTGQVLFRGTIKPYAKGKHTELLDLSPFSPGLYMVTLLNERTVLHGKCQLVK